VRRILLRSSPFVRSAKRVIKKDPRIAPDIEDALVRLEEDAFDSKLKTHKLKGKFKDSWAARDMICGLFSNLLSTKSLKLFYWNQLELMMRFIELDN